MEVRVLGPLEVAEDGRSIEVRPAKQRRLLAALAVDPGAARSTDALRTERGRLRARSERRRSSSCAAGSPFGLDRRENVTVSVDNSPPSVLSSIDLRGAQGHPLVFAVDHPTVVLKL